MRSDEPDRYEGENYVLDQQVVRAARKFSPVDKSPSIPKIQDFGKPAELIRALESRAMLLVHAARDDYARISRAIAKGRSHDRNTYGIEGCLSPGTCIQIHNRRHVPLILSAEPQCHFT